LGNAGLHVDPYDSPEVINLFTGGHRQNTECRCCSNCYPNGRKVYLGYIT